MNLYLMRRQFPENVGYDEWDMCVVAAESEDAARLIHPGGYERGSRQWNESAAFGWDHPEDVAVTCVGTAADGIVAGVVCASFNAG